MKDKHHNHLQHGNLHNLHNHQRHELFHNQNNLQDLLKAKRNRGIQHHSWHQSNGFWVKLMRLQRRDLHLTTLFTPLQLEYYNIHLQLSLYRIMEIISTTTGQDSTSTAMFCTPPITVDLASTRSDIDECENSKQAKFSMTNLMMRTLMDHQLLPMDVTSSRSYGSSHLNSSLTISIARMSTWFPMIITMEAMMSIYRWITTSTFRPTSNILSTMVMVNQVTQMQAVMIWELERQRIKRPVFLA